MKYDSWRAFGAISLCAGICSLLAACSSAPPVAPAAPAMVLNQDCAFTMTQSGDVGMACMLNAQIPDTQVDADHPGSTACSPSSFSVFRQDVNTALRLDYGVKGDDSPLRVRVGGALGPGTHSGKIGKSAGNDCDATLGTVAQISTRFGGDYAAMVDKTQRPMCISQSRLNLGSFNQNLSVVLPQDLGVVLRESARDVLQQRLDLEVATQANKLLLPGAGLLSGPLLSRHGRCPDGFRTLAGD